MYISKGMQPRIGKHSALFMKTDFREKGRMTMIEHSGALLLRIQDLMGKQGEYYKKYVCREIDGEPTLTLTMALGDKLDDDSIMST